MNERMSRFFFVFFVNFVCNSNEREISRAANWDMFVLEESFLIDKRTSSAIFIVVGFSLF